MSLREREYDSLKRPHKDARAMFNCRPDGLRQTIVAAIEAAKASGCP